MKNFTLALLMFFPITQLSAQDFIPYYTGFSYNASTCHLSISYYIKNAASDNGSTPNPVSYKVIIYDVDDNYEVFNTDVHVDKLGYGNTSSTKSFEIDLPALAGYEEHAIYKLAIIANPDFKSYEGFMYRDNNRIETPQFSCGTPSNRPKRVKNSKGNAQGETDNAANNTKSFAEMQKEMQADKEAFTEVRKEQSEKAIANSTSKINMYNREIEKLKTKKSNTSEDEKQTIQNLDTEIKILQLKTEIEQNVIYEQQDLTANKGFKLSKEQRQYYDKSKIDLENQIEELKKGVKPIPVAPKPISVEPVPSSTESTIASEAIENSLVLQKSKGSAKEIFYEGNFHENDQFRIVLANALAVPEYFKCKVTVTNKTSQYMIVKLSSVKVWIDGKYSTNFKEKDLVIAPGATSSKTYDVKGVNMSQEILRFDFNNITTYTDVAPL